MSNYQTNYNKDDTCIVFLHIPKCAGTTFINNIALNLYEDREVAIYYDSSTQLIIDKLKNMEADEKNKIKFVAGHFAFGIHQFLNKDKITYITILRDPLERVVSHYNYVCKKSNHYLHDVVSKNNYSLMDYVVKKLSIEMDNGQTRILAGIGWGRDFGLCDDAIFNQAKNNLDNYFSIVGVTEWFDLFVKIACRKFGWDYRVYENDNVGNYDTRISEIDTKTLEVICRYNYYDVKLYHYAKEKFIKILND